MEPDDVVVLDEDMAHIMASFGDRVYTKWNTRMAPDGSQVEQLGGAGEETPRWDRAGSAGPLFNAMGRIGKADTLS